MTYCTLPIQQLYDYQILLFMHKYVHKYLNYLLHFGLILMKVRRFSNIILGKKIIFTCMLLTLKVEKVNKIQGK